MLKQKNKLLYKYGVRKLNFKFNNAFVKNIEIIREVDDRTFLTELLELQEENRMWRRRNSEMYKFGVKKILNLK